MKPSILRLIPVCAVLVTPAQAQVRQAWVVRHTVGPAGTNMPVAMALDRDGNILIAGHGTSTNGDSDYVALKYSPGGTLLWSARHAGAGEDQVRSATADGAGNVILTGTSVSVKYDSNGAVQWTAPYGGRGVATDPSGDVYVTGFSETSFSTVKLHRDAGTNLWLRTANALPNGGDISHAIAVDVRSNVFVSGQTTCYSDPRFTYVNRRTLSYDSGGMLRWATAPDVCAYSSATIQALAVTSTREIIEVAAFDPGSPEVRKLARDGQVIWRVSLYSQPLQFQHLTSANTDNHGFVYLAGYAYDDFKSYFAIQKRHESGTNVWLATYTAGSGLKSANSISIDDNGNVYGTGQTPMSGNGNDYTTIKYSPDGHELWVQRYDGPSHGDDVATAIAVAPDGSVYVTGWSTTSSNLIEITTIKYAQSRSIAVETNRTVSLQFPAAPGSSNRVQATTDFLGWLDLGFSIADTNGVIRFIDTNAPSHPFRFYRTVSP